MARKETLGPKLIDLQKNAIAGNLYPEEDDDEHVFSRGPLYDEQLVHDVWEWCIKNEESPRAAERSLNRYSENFAGSEPLVLRDEPPQELQNKYPDWEERVGDLSYD